MRLVGGLFVSISMSVTIASPSLADTPRDFFAEAAAEALGYNLNGDWVNPQPDVNTGQIPGPTAEITSPVTNIYVDGNGQYNTIGNGYLASTGYSTAYANLSLGILRVGAGATSITNYGTSVGFPARADAYFGDTLDFKSHDTMTTVNFTVHLHGTLTDVSGLGYTTSGQPHVSLLVRTGQNTAAFCPNGFCPVVPSNVIGSDLVENFSLGSTFDAPLTIDQTYDESFTFTGAEAIVPILAELEAGGQLGLADFYHTVSLTFGPLPAGVSYTSASGYFLSGVPESSTWAMMLIGFAGLSFASLAPTARLRQGGRGV
jgi:hypothetical protein